MPAPPLVSWHRPAPTRSTVNEYHGYQLNAVIGNQGLDLFRDWLLSGKNLNNGLQVFASAEAGHKAGNPQLIR